MLKSPNSDDYTFDESAKPFLQGNAEFGTWHPEPKYFCDAALKEAPEGALLISVRAPVGAVNIADQSYGIGRGLCAVVPDNVYLLSQFAWYALTVTRNELWSIATGSTYEAVAANEVAAMTVMLPPLSEQRAIATFLDSETGRIDALIEKKQRQIELLQEKRSALISHTVTKGLDSNAKMKDSGIEWLGKIPEHWEISRLGRIAVNLQTGPFGSQLHATDYIENGVPVINPINLQGGEIVPDTRCTVSEEKFTQLGRHRLQESDIVFARRGEMGRCALVTEKSEGFLCGTGSLRVRLNAEVANPQYVSLLQGISGVQDHLLLESVGSTMDNLNTAILSRVPVTVPPLQEQIAIAKHVGSQIANIKAIIDTVLQSIDLLREYRTALISAAVTGKINVRGEIAS